MEDLRPEQPHSLCLQEARQIESMKQVQGPVRIVSVPRTVCAEVLPLPSAIEVSDHLGFES